MKYQIVREFLEVRPANGAWVQRCRVFLLGKWNNNTRGLRAICHCLQRAALNTAAPACPAQVGWSVLLSDVDVVTVQDPFKHLYRDSDVEGMSDGFDDNSAYGEIYGVDDPSMGWSRYAQVSVHFVQVPAGAGWASVCSQERGRWGRAAGTGAGQKKACSTAPKTCPRALRIQSCVWLNPLAVTLLRRCCAIPPPLACAGHAAHGPQLRPLLPARQRANNRPRAPH